MVGGVTLVGGNGSELTRLPGGAELNILPANGMCNTIRVLVPKLFVIRIFTPLLSHAAIRYCKKV